MKYSLLIAGLFLFSLLFWLVRQWEGPPARQAFVRDLNRIQVGMSVETVERIMGRYSKGVGSKWGKATAPTYPTGNARRQVSGTMTYRWDKPGGNYDADWGQVSFANGRVVKVVFLPD